MEGQGEVTQCWSQEATAQLAIGGTFPAKHVNDDGSADQRSISHTSAFAEEASPPTLPYIRLQASSGSKSWRAIVRIKLHGEFIIL